MPWTLFLVCISRIRAEYDWIRDNICQPKHPPAWFGCISTLDAVAFHEKKEITLVIGDGVGSWMGEGETPREF